MSVYTLGISLTEAQNQRTTKCRWILGLKVSCCVEEIKKIRECELHRLEAMVGLPFTPTSKPFDLPLLFERLGWK